MAGWGLEKSVWKPEEKVAKSIQMIFCLLLNLLDVL
jgi:hypothetical protein